MLGIRYGGRQRDWMILSSIKVQPPLDPGPYLITLSPFLNLVTSGLTSMISPVTSVPRMLGYGMGKMAASWMTQSTGLMDIAWFLMRTSPDSGVYMSALSTTSGLLCFSLIQAAWFAMIHTRRLKVLFNILMLKRRMNVSEILLTKTEPLSCTWREVK